MTAIPLQRQANHLLPLSGKCQREQFNNSSTSWSSSIQLSLDGLEDIEMENEAMPKVRLSELSFKDLESITLWNKILLNQIIPVST